jgi:hypothetical protein
MGRGSPTSPGTNSHTAHVDRESSTTAPRGCGHQESAAPKQDEQQARSSLVLRGQVFVDLLEDVIRLGGEVLLEMWLQAHDPAS